MPQHPGAAGSAVVAPASGAGSDAWVGDTSPWVCDLGLPSE